MCIVFSSYLVLPIIIITSHGSIEYFYFLFYTFRTTKPTNFKNPITLYIKISHKTSAKNKMQNSRNLEFWVSSELVNCFKRWRAIYQFISYMLQWLLSIYSVDAFLPLLFPTLNSLYRTLRASATQCLATNGI